MNRLLNTLGSVTELRHQKMDRLRLEEMRGINSSSDRFRLLNVRKTSLENCFVLSVFLVIFRN